MRQKKTTVPNAVSIRLRGKRDGGKDGRRTTHWNPNIPPLQPEFRAGEEISFLLHGSPSEEKPGPCIENFRWQWPCRFQLPPTQRPSNFAFVGSEKEDCGKAVPHSAPA